MKLISKTLFLLIIFTLFFNNTVLAASTDIDDPEANEVSSSNSIDDEDEDEDEDVDEDIEEDDDTPSNSTSNSTSNTSNTSNSTSSSNRVSNDTSTNAKSTTGSTAGNTTTTQSGINNSELGISNILSILLIAIGALLILLAIAVLIRIGK